MNKNAFLWLGIVLGVIFVIGGVSYLYYRFVSEMERIATISEEKSLETALLHKELVSLRGEVSDTNLKVHDVNTKLTYLHEGNVMPVRGGGKNGKAGASDTESEYVPILLTLISLENKLVFGGNVESEILKLTVFSAKFPALRIAVLKIRDIKTLTSMEDLKKEFGEYVKNIRSIHLAQKGGRFSKIFSVFARYITVLDASDESESALVGMQDFIKQNNFAGAYQISLQIKGNDNTADFEKKLEETTKMEKTMRAMYNIISLQI